MSTAPATAEKDWMLATLKELAEIGMELAREVQTQVQQAGGAAAAEAALRFSRISRAVRQTVALYGLVLEDKLALKAPGERPPKPPAQKDIDAGARVREACAPSARISLECLAPPEALDAFHSEIEEWLSDKTLDHLYAGRIGEVTAEILLMLGLIVPDGMVHIDQQRALIRGEERREAQPWRAAWEFLKGRDRPHLDLLKGWDPWDAPCLEWRRRSLGGGPPGERARHDEDLEFET